MAAPSEAYELSPVTLEDFFQQVREYNPFTDNRITGPADEADVEEVNRPAFDRLAALAWESLNTRRGLGAVVWGEAGTGKSHLLARLARWARRDNRTCLVYLHNLQASPDNLPRALLRAVVDALTWREGNSFHATPLVHMIHVALQNVLGTTGNFSWGEIERTFVREITRHSPQGPADAALADRTVQMVLFRFFRSVHRAGQGKEDSTVASLAVQWLRGDALSPEQGRQLRLPPPRHNNDPVVLEDNQQIKQVLVALTALAACRRQPFVLCLDQIDTLDEEQFAALGRFLEALIDSARNLLVVTAGIQSSLVEWQERHVVQEAAWDRVAQFKLSLPNLSPEQARPLIEKRLQAFLEPFDEVSAVREMAFNDPLFPLGNRWFDEVMNGRTELRPRDVINDARERWQFEQQELARMSGEAWLRKWKERRSSPSTPRPPSVPSLTEVIDHLVEEKMAEHQRAVRTIPDPESVSESVGQLLDQCRELSGDYGLLRIEPREKGKSGLPPTYNLVVHHRGPEEGTEVRTGVIFVPASNPWAMFHVVDRLREDEHPPQRVLLIADENGLDVGTKGEEYLAELRQRPNYDLKVLQLPLIDFATLDALHAVWNMAKSEDLELQMSDGSTRVVTAKEVEQSHHRQGRYRAAPVLSDVLAVPETVEAVLANDNDTELVEDITETLSIDEVVLGEDAIEAE